MIKKNYKKILVIVAALFILFAPVGMTINEGISSAQGIAGNLSVEKSHYSTFHLSFNLDLAKASDTTPISTGASVGQTAKAQSPNLYTCVSSPATCGVYYTALVINGAMGLLLVGGAFLVKLGLNFNENIFNAPAVQIGFSVSLAIANLGFVLGIIIIAIATIIRNQTYGMKQLLWKLVFMAILVNFGLVITAPIVGFANSMSTYFINATSPSAATGGYGAYVTTMMSAFNPQAVNEAPAASGSTLGAIDSAICSHPILTAAGATFLTGATLGAGGVFAVGIVLACNIPGLQPSDPTDNFWQSTMALLFDIAFSAIAAFTFLCLAILLIIRYLMLGGLLIVLPLAWLTYVFPKFDNSFSKWWNTFIKWTFFPPLALFFIYLAFTTAAITGGANTTTSASSYTASAIGGTDTDTTLITGLNKQTGLSGGIFEQAADEVLLVGLMIMGLMFASSLAGKAGSTAVNLGRSGSKMAAGYVGRKGKQAASRAAGRAVPQKLKDNLQAGNYRFIPKRLQVATGVGLGNLERSGRGDLVAAEAKNAESLAKDPQQFARILGGEAGSFGRGGVSKERRMAMLGQLAKDEDLQKEVSKQGGGHMVVEGKSMQQFLKENEGEFKGLQQGKLYDTLKDKSGLTPLELAQKNEGVSDTALELGKKKELQEIQGMLQSEKDPESTGKLSDEQKGKLAAYQKRKKDLEELADLGEIHGPERKELTEMQKMEAATGNYMSEEEMSRYQKAQETFTENNNKIKAWTAKNPDIAADSFQDHDKARAKLIAEGKPVPLTFAPEAVKQVQQSIVTAMAEGFSPQNAKALIDSIGKKNNLKYFEGAMGNMDPKTTAQIKSLAASNKSLASWIRNSPGASTVVDLNQMFGIAKAKRQPRQNRNNP